MLFEARGASDWNKAYEACEAIQDDKASFLLLCGYDNYDAMLRFLQKVCQKSRQNGVYLKSSLMNPSEVEAAELVKAVGNEYIYDVEHVLRDIRKALAGIELGTAQRLCAATLETIDFLQKQNANTAMLKNAYVKFLCWFRGSLSKATYKAGRNPLPTILHDGDLSKYELYALRTLARAGCKVVCYNISGSVSYAKIDPTNAFGPVLEGKTREKISEDLDRMDLNAINRVHSTQKKIENIECSIVTNSWLNEHAFDCAPKTNSQRGGGSLKLHNIFMRFIGADDHDRYLNRLFNLGSALKSSSKKFILIDKKIENPAITECVAIPRIATTDNKAIIARLMSLIKICDHERPNLLFQNAFNEIMNKVSGNPTRIYNLGVQYVCWLNRYKADLKAITTECMPCFIYYGECSLKEREFLCLLALSGSDVLILNSDKTSNDVFAELGSACLKEELDNSMPLEPFPEKEVRLRVSTVAYNAERELDQMIYSDTGIFRNRQFKRSCPITLKTTYEELLLIWKEKANVRPYFEANDGKVVVPNIFAKICGVKNGDVVSYFDSICNLVTDDTLVITKLPYIKSDAENKLKRSTNLFVRDGKLQIEQIKSNKAYQYDHLGENTQDYILEKIQELLELKWLKNIEDLDKLIITTLLNLDKKILQMIQSFDFTSDLPKVLIIDADEAMISPEDGILIAFLNLVGFDIAVFTPTGYRNIDKHIINTAFEQHDIGELEFNLVVPAIKAGGMGFMDKLFGIRRKN